MIAILSAVALSLGNIVASNAQERESNDSTFLQKTNLTDAGAALQGKFSGLLVMNPSGAPGETAKLRVRGFTSDLGNGGPLLIVDGLKVSDIQHLDPSMIEKVEILKDAAATALYGIQGGNGVIRITTRKGSGKLSVGYDFKLTSSSLGRKADILNAEEWIENQKIRTWYDIDGKLQENGYDGTDTDWQDVVYGNGFAHQHGLTVQGGNDKGGFFAAFNYLDNDGIVKGAYDTHRRIGAQVNGSYQFTEWLQVGINASFATQNIKYIEQQMEYDTLFADLLTHDPLTKPYFNDPSEFTADMYREYSNGKNILKDPSNGLYYAASKYTESINPLIYRVTDQCNIENLDMNGIVYARLTPFKGFTFTGRFGYKLEQRDQPDILSVPYYFSDRLKYDYYTFSVNENSHNGYQADASAEYSFIKGGHDLNAKAGFYYENTSLVSRKGSGFTENTAIGPDDINIETTELGFSDLAFFAQACYTFGDRYGIQASFRADKFQSPNILAEEFSWCFFPTISAGWTISNEPFFKNNVSRNAISRLAVKASWGKGGSTSDYETFSYAFLNSGFETSEHLNIGIETSLFKNRLNIIADWFQKKTENIPFYASNTIYAVHSSVMNSGVDLEMSWYDRIGDFSYGISGNFSTLNNEVMSLGDGNENIIRLTAGSSSYGVKTAYETGKPMWYLYGYSADTKFENYDYWEMTYLGQGIPTMYYGTSINLAYKGFDLYVSGYGTAGNSIANCIFGPVSGSKNIIKDFLGDEWQEYGQYKSQSGAVVFDGSFFRIKQLQLGYTIPERLTQKIFIQNARVFVSLDDWFTFSSYPCGDPETATTGTRMTNSIYSPFNGYIEQMPYGTDRLLGIDYGSYPMSKKLVFGLSIRF